MKILKYKVIIFSMLASLYLAGCSGINFSQWRFPYMYPVQQGNYITAQQINLLKIGMTKDQVSFVIGHPVSQFMFKSSQWQYVYQQYKNDKLSNSYVVNINFDSQDLVGSVESAGAVFVK